MKKTGRIGCRECVPGLPCVGCMLGSRPEPGDLDQDGEVVEPDDNADDVTSWMRGQQ